MLDSLASGVKDEPQLAPPGGQCVAPSGVWKDVGLKKLVTSKLESLQYQLTKQVALWTNDRHPHQNWSLQYQLTKQVALWTDDRHPHQN